jgi:hypothetical protein|tara:strand:+ start:289 stop:492 length:204 start_codon:yes stop_codon:yes gene_type:complete
MKTKQISVKEYAEKISPNHFRANRKYPNSPMTAQAIKYRIKNNLALPEVIKYNRVGKVHVLMVNANF